MKNNIAIQLKKNLNNDLINNLKKNYLDRNNYYIIFKNFENNPKILKKKIKKLAALLGKTLSQNKSGKKYIEVKPNASLIKNLTMGKKRQLLRYHQTNLGGSIHSDGPQLDSPPNYILMACIKQAEKGGYSIITYANKIYDFLKRKNPNYFNILKKKFLFERRGFNYSNQNIFEKPIFEKKKNFFRFRYLREYIEEAYNIKNIRLKSEQINALNFLDSLIESKRFQKKYKLNEGDVIILNNNVLAHGRTKFSLGLAEQRTLMRVWVK